MFMIHTPPCWDWKSSVLLFTLEETDSSRLDNLPKEQHWNLYPGFLTSHPMFMFCCSIALSPENSGKSTIWTAAQFHRYLNFDPITENDKMVFWVFESLLGAKGIGEHVSCIRAKQTETAVKKVKPRPHICLIY